MKPYQRYKSEAVVSWYFQYFELECGLTKIKSHHKLHQFFSPCRFQSHLVALCSRWRWFSCHGDWTSIFRLRDMKLHHHLDNWEVRPLMTVKRCDWKLQKKHRNYPLNFVNDEHKKYHLLSFLTSENVAHFSCIWIISLSRSLAKSLITQIVMIFVDCKRGLLGLLPSKACNNSKIQAYSL